MSNNAEDARPDILWIQCDELRADALSYDLESPLPIQTPNLDRLARSGVWFDRAYTPSPVCVPARTAMLTSVAPHRSGVLGNEAYAAGYPEVELPPTFPEILAEAGWRTVNIGKEHVPSFVRPWQHHDPVGSKMGELIDQARQAEAPILRTPVIGHPVAATLPEDVTLVSSRLTDAAIEQMQAPRDQPLLLRASYLQPHTPVVVPEPWASQYAGAGIPARQDSENEFERRFGEINGRDQLSSEDRDAAIVAYHGAVAWLDAQVGRLLDALEATGRENTIVVLSSDHGAHLGENGGWGKHTFSPPSHRVPFLISWPGRLPGGTRRGDLAQGMDLGPTLFGLLGIDAPSQDGRDLFADDAPDAIISSIGYGERASRAFPNLDAGEWGDGVGWPLRACIRTARFRLDMTVRVAGRDAEQSEQAVFLADAAHDPAELRNVADDEEYAAVRAELQRRLERTWAQEARLPEPARVYASFTGSVPATGKPA